MVEKKPKNPSMINFLIQWDKEENLKDKIWALNPREYVEEEL